MSWGEDFSGRSVVLTGANSGIGLATLDGFIDAGADVLAVDLNDDVMSTRKCTSLRLDVASQDAPSIIRQSAERMKGLDILANCAGIGGSRSLADSDDALIDRILGVNLRSVMRITRDLIPLMRSGSSVVNVTSVFGHVGRAGTAAYAASKGALSQLTRQLCADLGPQGIRVNAVAPGVILTAMTRDKIENDEEYQRTMIGGTPLKRIGTPEDVVEVILFLASDRARFVSGQILAVDGGWLAVRGPN
ncbi:SDR family oxidoreductase [Hoeflea sp. YIM 152468]|uniref:SDR family NAD(P)-dependent oxidoreductase n=1 Tax=Hoeflea sp. YIM 152468 TaxID=3031759 RepID=UPI0023D9A3AE|nr:SDR family oxidoreductase [Hoeflea sp. YIM 152468]MDF1608644.1 SDR family oxidoreductase [Hoeflea sp. YIM 152468]